MRLLPGLPVGVAAHLDRPALVVIGHQAPVPAGFVLQGLVLAWQNQERFAPRRYCCQNPDFELYLVKLHKRTILWLG